MGGQGFDATCCSDLHERRSYRAKNDCLFYSGGPGVIAINLAHFKTNIKKRCFGKTQHHIIGAKILDVQNAVKTGNSDAANKKDKARSGTRE